MLITAVYGEMMRFNAGYLMKVLEGLPPEKYFVRPEGRGNTVMWLLGHVAVNRGEIIELLGGEPKVRDLADLFARGTRPESDTAIYPTPANLLSRFIKLAALTDHLLKQCDQALMDRPSWGQFDTVGQNLAYSYMHEVHHIGQITYVVNLPSVRVAKKQTVFTRGNNKESSTSKIILDSIKSVFT